MTKQYLAKFRKHFLAMEYNKEFYKRSDGVICRYDCRVNLLTGYHRSSTSVVESVPSIIKGYTEIGLKD